ncbi:MAG: fibronectin type III domain-containing protein [bacterium]|nr:fibronectin type III domain-containing protein [bacterium]
MKNFLKFLILPIVAITTLGGFAPSALADVSPMTTVFENSPSPLFGEVNFLPGDSKDGDVSVTNNTSTSQSVYAESVNGFDPDGLGSQLYLKVFENSGIIYQDEFDDFLSAGPVPLSSLGAANTTTYTFEVSFINSADNDYMGKSLGFDLCIGFSGGAFQCGDTVVGGGGDTGGGGGSPSTGSGSSSGSGGGGQFLQLVIFNENALVVNPGTPVANPDGVADVTWQTNLLSTSQVVYGLASGTYILDLNSSTFGYTFATAENPLKVINHSVTLTDLIQGQTYVYRVVSRASPPTVSVEHQFNLAFASPQTPSSPSPQLSSGQAGSVSSIGGTGGTSAGNTLQAGTSGEEIATGSTSSPQAATPTLQLASALFGLPAGLLDFFKSYSCLLIPLLMLLGIYLLWILVSRWRGYEDMMSPYEYRRKQIAFHIIGILLMLAYALIFWNQCIIIPLLVILAVLVAWLAWHHYSNRL